MRNYLPLALLLAGFAANLSAAEVRSLQLSPKERAQLEAAACRSRHDVQVDRIDARSYGAGANAPAVAEVHCASHGESGGQPMHFVVQCARERQQWQCQGEWNELAVVLDTKSIAVRIEGKLSAADAVKTIRKIAASGKFQGYVLRDALVPPCYIQQQPGQEFIDVRCEGWHLIVSTWCPQGDCPRLISIDKFAR
jgi:hypothetical protein